MSLEDPRRSAWARLKDSGPWDLAVIGGGATGLGVALDAAVRGLSVVLLEAVDFAAGTSSRATKLVHGGVRYLAQGDLGLVHEALQERALLLAHAPHVAQPLQFVVPAYRLWEGPFYGAGLKAYDALALGRRLGPTQFLGPNATQRALPSVKRSGLCGGVSYWDGQFDDARMAVLLARTAAQRGALVLNHARVVALAKETQEGCGAQWVLTVQDALGARAESVRARCVVNATGVWVDSVRDLDRASPTSTDETHARLVKPSQGVHLVVDRSFLPGSRALMVPRTRDGRVLFAVPWMGKTILGTTDTPRDDIVREPRPLASEVDFILTETAAYLDPAPQRRDVRSVWVGLRPLVQPQGKTDQSTSGATASLSREHTVMVDPSGLVTVTGGKWTTYRAMAQDVLKQCMTHGLLPSRPAGATTSLPLLGAQDLPSTSSRSLADPPGVHLYGSEARALQALPGAHRWLAFDAETGTGILSEAMVRFAVRHEMARDVEDVLARRSRLLFLDARQAAEVAGAVAAIVKMELGDAFDEPTSVAAFQALAAQYATVP